MEIRKQAEALSGMTPDERQLGLIHQQSRTPLKPEEVYVFPVRLCDDQVDRDYERFDAGALEALGKLFVGKPGIVDHNWSAEKQIARIFETEVIRETDHLWLKGWAYMPREGRESLIRDIESGIRREVSISCSMEKKECSICGGHLGSCGHRAGGTYDGKVCVGILKEPRDAYEFSFVAVPAQPKAGVVKGRKGGEEMSLKEFVESSGLESLKKELGKLKALAAFGETVRKEREQEVARMGVALELGMTRKELEELALQLEDETLEKLWKGLSGKMHEIHGGGPQLTAEAGKQEEKDAYLI